MRLAGRYGTAVLMLLALGAIAPVTSALLPRRAPSCVEPDAIFEAFRPRTESLAEAGTNEWGIAQRAVGVVKEHSQKIRTTFRLVESYNPKALYLNPKRFAERSSDLKGAATPIVIETDYGALPAWQLMIHTAVATRTVAYFFTQDREALRSPFRRHLASFWRGWRDGVLPMRLYLVTVDTGIGREELADKRARAWLRQAFGRHQKACAG